jgi:hypothetical protein
LASCVDFRPEPLNQFQRCGRSASISSSWGTLPVWVRSSMSGLGLMIGRLRMRTSDVSSDNDRSLRTTLTFTVRPDDSGADSRRTDSWFNLLNSRVRRIGFLKSRSWSRNDDGFERCGTMLALNKRPSYRMPMRSGEQSSSPLQCQAHGTRGPLTEASNTTSAS